MSMYQKLVATTWIMHLISKLQMSVSTAGGNKNMDYFSHVNDFNVNMPRTSGNNMDFASDINVLIAGNLTVSGDENVDHFSDFEVSSFNNYAKKHKIATYLSKNLQLISSR